MERVRLAELCASTSLFTDLGTGQPVEHGLRTCLTAMRLAEALGLAAEERREVFYVTLLRFLGCTADAHVVGEIADGNDVGLLAGMAPVTMGSPREELAQMIRLVAEGAPLPHRLASLARALTDPRSKDQLLRAHCEVASRLAREMGLPGGVTSALEVAYARWDGRGVPRDVGGESIPVSMRVAIVARDLELWARETGTKVASQVLRRRRGRSYAPAVVDAALETGVGRLRECEDDLWDVVLAYEPTPWAEVRGPDVGRALAALGDFTDLKTPELSGHSRRVARIVTDAGRAAGLATAQISTLDRAGLVHDLGMVAVPVGVLHSTGEMGPRGSEQLRMHPLWTQRILIRCSGLSTVASLAGRHHERIDGTGYPAGISGPEPGGAGLLACVEMFEEMTHPGRGSPGIEPADAAREMIRLAAEGALSVDDVKAVFDALDLATPPLEVDRPAQLTEREVDVLALMARGSTNRQIASTLGISPKTVGTHVEHIYAKAGVTTRAAATLFAVRNGLVRPAVR